MANRLDIGEVVANQMQQIIQSDEHNRVFFKKAGKCCSCSSCGDKCPCDKCEKDCTACSKDKAHVHDANCAHDKTASAIDEMIDLLAKISAVQDELGLVKSSFVTMQALATMVAELRKTAQVDTNDVSWSELIEPIKEDTEKRREFRETADEFPDIMDLLRRRVEESHAGSMSPPVDIFEEGVSADPVTPLPSDGPSEPPVVVAPDSDDLPTWHPEAGVAPTELPPESVTLDKPLPAEGNVTGFNEFIEPDLESEVRDTPTMPVPKGAFKRLEELLKKQAQDDPDFEDEAELAELFEDAENRAMFGIDNSSADDSMWASDLDEELENGDFLESPEDRDDGFTYGPDETGESHKIRMDNEFDGRTIKDWVDFDTLSPEEKLEHEMGAGLHERLDMDPDELTTEQVYPEEWEDTDEAAFNKIRDGLPSPEDDDYDPQQSRYWNDDVDEIPTVSTKDLKMKPKNWWEDPKFPIYEWEGKV